VPPCPHAAAPRAQTFDTIYESLDLTSMLVRAKLMQSSMFLKIAPPPLNLIGIPSRILHALWLRTTCGADAQGYQYKRLQKKRTAQKDLLVSLRDTYTPEKALEVQNTEYTQLLVSALGFVTEHFADADSEDKFRRKIAQRIVKLAADLAAVDSRTNMMAADIKAIGNKTGAFKPSKSEPVSQTASPAAAGKAGGK
jgi:hypothetical protein